MARQAPAGSGQVGGNARGESGSGGNLRKANPEGRGGPMVGEKAVL